MQPQRKKLYVVVNNTGLSRAFDHPDQAEDYIEYNAMCFDNVWDTPADIELDPERKQEYEKDLALIKSFRVEEVEYVV